MAFSTYNSHIGIGIARQIMRLTKQQDFSDPSDINKHPVAVYALTGEVRGRHQARFSGKGLLLHRDWRVNRHRLVIH